MVVRTFQSALARQVAEAVRTRQRGTENILNKQGVFNRCAIPELTVVHNDRIWEEEKRKFGKEEEEGNEHELAMEGTSPINSFSSLSRVPSTA